MRQHQQQQKKITTTTTTTTTGDNNDNSHTKALHGEFSLPTPAVVHRRHKNYFKLYGGYLLMSVHCTHTHTREFSRTYHKLINA